ncbi:protein PAXX isoform X8 [Caloenas nicobarica]|uniref:protein PAXX isoform X8 n=1 Tax=Caloenas nicobarica TaxID=187106 RepID=UPI0032B75245
MAEPAGPFRLLRAGPGRFLCYCRPGPGPGGTVYVTDALEVWAGELGARPPLGCWWRQRYLPAALRRTLPTASSSSYQDTLSPLSCGCCRLPRCPGVVPGTEGAGAQLGGSWSVQDALCADPSPRKNRGAVSALPAKRKIPGESLINPGFKSKKAPSGVDFEDS